MKTEHDYTFCPHCGAHFEKKEHNLLVCPNCNLHFYINPKICNGIIIENEKGEILLVKRARDPFKGYWDLPGGFVDLDETIEASVHRELMEELHVKIDDLHYIGSVHDSYEFEGLTFKTICVLFLGSIDSHAPIQVDDDAEAYAFFAKEKIPYDNLAFEGIREAVRLYTKTKP